MEDILYQYTQVERTTWVYMSSLMAIALYFKFSRLWSVRNLDLLGLIAIGPGMLMATGQSQQLGYVWLFAVGLFFLVRLLFDPMMVRRPLLEPNLSVGGLTFMVCALFAFLMANVITGNVTDSDLEGAQRLDQLLSRQESPEAADFLRQHGPGYPLLHLLATVPGQALMDVDLAAPEDSDALLIHRATTRTMAILSHLAMIIGLVLIGYRHFGNASTGIAAAGLYLLMPYSAQMVGRVDHWLPAALLVWAVLMYRRPLAAGVFIGLAAGATYFPVFLLPLWAAFYWHRGLVRFLVGMLGTIALLIGSLVFTSSSADVFWMQVQQMIGWASLTGPVDGFWSYYVPAYRIPVLALFVAMCFSLAIWPAQKNLGTLLCCSAAVMLGAQFWHAQQGGLYVAWYLPMLLLTIFRPNLEDRVALSVLGEGWLARRRAPESTVDRAA